jgi:hypothetical protein
MGRYRLAPRCSLCQPWRSFKTSWAWYADDHAQAFQATCARLHRALPSLTPALMSGHCVIIPIYLLLLGAWLTVAARTARGSVTGRLFRPAPAAAPSQTDPLG